MAPRRVDPAHQMTLVLAGGYWVATCGCGWQERHARRDRARLSHHVHAAEALKAEGTTAEDPSVMTDH
jgi:hypothetical protein